MDVSFTLYFVFLAVAVVFVALSFLPNLSRSGKLALSVLGAVCAGIAAIVSLASIL